VFEKPKESISCAWGEVKEMHMQDLPTLNPYARRDNYYVGKDRTYLVVRRDGPPINLGAFLGRNPILWGTLQERTLPSLLPAYLADLDNAKTVNFGEVQGTGDGLRSGKEKLAWKDIKNAKFHNGRVWIQHKTDKRKDWTFETPNAVPNVHVLVALTRKMAQLPGS